MPQVKEETRDRVLRAAVDEFAAHGLAGGRMDRIAAAAGLNIKSVYLAYGAKRELFDASVTAVLGQIGVDVPFTADDLPGWAGRFFDAITAGDAAHRLNLWRMLESPLAGPDDRQAWSAALSKLAGLRPAKTEVPADDLLIMVPAMAAGWLSTSRDLGAAAGISESETRRQRYRTSLVTAVRVLTETRASTDGVIGTTKTARRRR